MVNLELLSQPSVLQLARAGNFQAIAYWLNTYLVPQDIYARVAVDRPGWLLVLVEFCQPPDCDRLNRFVCHRLCRLNSSVIQGVRIMARPLGSPNIWWDRSIRLTSEPSRPARRVRSHHSSRRAVQIRPLTSPSLAPRSPVPPPSHPLAPHPLRRRRRSPGALMLARSAASPTRVDIQALTNSARALTSSLVESARQLSPVQVAMLGKAAAAVFLVGFGVEIAGRMSLWNDSSGRPRAVQTSAGKVSVIQAPAVVNADDPTVTLTFSSDPAVNLTSTQSLTPVTPTAEITDATTGWSTGESSDRAQATDALGTDALNTDGMDSSDSLSGSGSETAHAIATSTGILPSAVAPNVHSDILMTNLNRQVNDESPLDLTSGLGVRSDLSSNLDTDTTGLRSPGDSVTVVNLSGESPMQSGSSGLVKTLDVLEQAGMYAVGAGRNRDEARRPEIIDVRGKRIAYLGYADSEAHAANRWQAGTNPAVKDRVAEDIRAIRDQVDWVVVNYHWSQDLASFPANWQTTMAHHAIDQGADLVVGYHPDVLQGAEIYKGRAIAYSLGDFVFQDSGQAVNTSAKNASPGRDKTLVTPAKTQYDTAMLKVSIKDDQMRLEFLPVQVKDSKPAIAQDEKNAEILRYLNQASALFETPLRSPVILNRLTHTEVPSTGSRQAPSQIPSAVPSIAPEAAPTAAPLPSTDESIPSPNKRSPENASDSFIDYPNPAIAPNSSSPSPRPGEVNPSSDSFITPKTPLPSSTDGNDELQSSAADHLSSQGTSQASRGILQPSIPSSVMAEMPSLQRLTVSSASQATSDTAIAQAVSSKIFSGEIASDAPAWAEVSESEGAGIPAP